MVLGIKMLYVTINTEQMLKTGLISTFYIPAIYCRLFDQN